MSDSVTVAFIGHTRPDMAEQAAAFEDEALGLLVELGGTVQFRGRRVAGADQSLPAEVHILSFPSRQMFDSYLQHERRRQLLTQHGDVFESKVVVELSPIAEGPATVQKRP